MRFIVISGLSGAGKSVALHTLEDVGFQCIDNLPIELLETFIEQTTALPTRDGQSRDVAVSIDIRMLGKNTSGRVRSLISKIKGAGIDTDLVFLSADDGILIRRYREAKRVHPLAAEKHTLEEAIALEKDRLDELSALATYRVNTTSFNLYQLRETILAWLKRETSKLLVILQSFSYKKGTPRNADYVFDARCLDNPYWRLDLRDLSGLDDAVADFLKKQALSQTMLEDFSGFLKRWLPRVSPSSRSVLTVAVGCTGGRHRSVFIVERLYALLSRQIKECAFIRRHRDWR